MEEMVVPEVQEYLVQFQEQPQIMQEVAVVVLKLAIKLVVLVVVELVETNPVKMEEME